MRFMARFKLSEAQLNVITWPINCALHGCICDGVNLYRKGHTAWAIRAILDDYTLYYHLQHRKAGDA